MHWFWTILVPTLQLDPPYDFFSIHNPAQTVGKVCERDFWTNLMPEAVQSYDAQVRAISHGVGDSSKSMALGRAARAWHWGEE